MIISLISITFTLLLLYRNATYFCISFLYLENILNSLMNHSSFLRISLVFPMCTIMPSANNDRFTSFPMWIPLISLSCLFTVDRKSKNMFNKSGESGHSYIFLIVEEIFQLFTVEYDISCRFVIYDLYFLKYVPYSSTFWRIFILSGCWTLSKTFPPSIKIIFYFFIISLLLCIKLYHIDHTDLYVTLICGYWKILSSLG